ncbi:MAG: hypothetical protein ACK41T_07325 [Pseudobdellovibrio sp.]
MKIFWFILIQFFLIHLAQAEVLFEGYYKVSQFKKHIGFYILKTEVDSKNNRFKTTSFLKLSKNGFNMTESLTANSTTDFTPVDYSYLATDGTKSKTIDITFKNDMMTGLISENGEKKKISKKLPKGTFLSSSLYYMMMKSKDGLKTGTKFEFSAIAEEMADIAKGSSSIDKKMTSRGVLQLLKVDNSFAGMDYENMITQQGQTISSNTKATGLETELVKNKEEALQDIKISSGTLEKIFGNIPEGKNNILNN